MFFIVFVLAIFIEQFLKRALTPICFCLTKFFVDFCAPSSVLEKLKLQYAVRLR